MPLSLELPNEYGAVLLVATGSFFVNTYHGILTSKFRKASGLKYPIAYASNELADKDPKAYAFNCAQKAHANFTENQPSFLGALLISGLHFPRVAAGLGAGWVIARLLYAVGYTSTRGPKGRMTGSLLGSLIDVSLKFLAVYTSVMITLGK